jgi:antibiotic biosynthesis monooxygenase (ABM) superfamily enzyme
MKHIVNDIREGIANKRGDFYGNLKHWITGGRRATKLDVGAETLCNRSTHVRTNSSDMYATKKHSPRHE